MQKKSINYKILRNCRLCDSKRIRIIYNFNAVPIGNELKSSRNSSIKSRRYPLKLMNCKVCNHFQLSISIKPKILFTKNYTYLTGITRTFENHFETYAKFIIKKCKLKNSSLVIDIGSNDGTCLKHFKKNKMKVLGIDPAKLPSKIAINKGINTINSFFNKKTAEIILKKYGHVDFVTSHNVLAHTENIKEIFTSIFAILKKNGYFCFEIGYFQDVLKKKLFDTIYHEHLDYHHAGPLINFLETIGFSAIDISTNSIQGATLRLLLQKKDIIKEKSKKIKNFIRKEKIYFKLSGIKQQFKQFEKSMIKFNRIVIKAKLKGNSISAYGSPTKASLLLIASRLNKGIIENAFEDNNLKCNKYIPGTDIKIINSKNIKNINPKIIIILAWNFAKEIILKLKERNFKKITLITPLPETKVNII
jgi:SAM-dependent methyltransferase